MKKLPLPGQRIDCPKCERGDMSQNLKWYRELEKIVLMCGCCGYSECYLPRDSN